MKIIYKNVQLSGKKEDIISILNELWNEDNSSKIKSIGINEVQKFQIDQMVKIINIDRGFNGIIGIIKSFSTPYYKVEFNCISLQFLENELETI